MSVSEQLRRVIRSSGLTHYRIGTDTGLSINTIGRFVAGGTSTHTDTFDALCEYFGLELRAKKQSTTRKRPAKKRTAAKKKTR